MDGYKFFLFYVFLIGCRAAVIPDPVSSVAIRPSGDANTASNTQIENPEEIKIAAKPDNAAENANTAQSSTSENLSPKSASANAPPSLSGKQTEQSVITADKQVTSVSKVKTASQAAQRKRKTKRILKKLSMQSMDKLRKLVLSKSLKSKSLRRLALMTYVQKANKEGMTSDSIYGKTRLQQFQMDKLMKLSADAVKKLVLNEVKVSDRTRENALKVYLKMNLPSRSEEKVKAITVETPKKKAMNTPPPGVKKGSNVIPWSKANEESKFPVQTHIKPVDISKLMPDSTPPEIIETNLKPEISKPDQGVRTGENVKTVTAQISKEKVAITLPQGVKKGSNVMSWSKENENSEFPVQTHAKALDISKIMPDSTAPESIDTNVKPDISKQDRDVNTGEKVKTVTVQTLMKKVANTPPQGVKKGSNVMQWSKENENSKFPEQTHTKPEDISKLMPDSTPPETIDAKVKPEIRKPGQVVKTGEYAKTVTAQISKEKVAITLPQGVKKGSNVMSWSKENENSEFPVQTHAKALDISKIMPDSTAPESIDTNVKPDISKQDRDVNTGEKVKTVTVQTLMKKVANTPPQGVKKGSNVMQWSKENENSKFPEQTHTKPEDISKLMPDSTPPETIDAKVKPEIRKPGQVVKTGENAKTVTAQIPKKVANTIPQGVKKGSNVMQWSKENENSDFPVQTHARQELSELMSDSKPKVVEDIKPEIEKPEAGVKSGDNVPQWSPETENALLQTHARKDLNPVPSSKVIKETNIKPEMSKPDSSVKIADNVPELSPETENIIMQTHARQPSLEELNPVPSSKVVKGTINKPEISKPDSSVKIADNVPELSPETENALVQTHTNAEPNIPMMHSETPLSTLTQQIVKEGLRSIREPKTKPPQSDKTMTENNAELSFSSPVGQQQISASDTEAGTTHEKTNPTEMVSSFKKTSVVSMGKPDPPRTAPEGSILSDKDISALVSSFFYDPEHQILDIQQPVVIPAAEVHSGITAYQEPQFAAVSDTNQQAFIGEPKPVVSVQSGARSDNFLSILDVPDEGVQSVQSYHSNVPSSLNVAKEEPALYERSSEKKNSNQNMADITPMVQIPEKNSDIIPQNSDSDMSIASFKPRSASKAAKEQTSGVIRVENSKLKQQGMTPWGAGNTITEIRTITEIPEDIPPEVNNVQNGELDLINSLAETQRLLGQINTISTLLRTLQSSAFHTLPNTISDSRQSQEVLQQSSPSSGVTDQDIASVVSSFFR